MTEQSFTQHPQAINIQVKTGTAPDAYNETDAGTFIAMHLVDMQLYVKNSHATNSLRYRITKIFDSTGVRTEVVAERMLKKGEYYLETLIPGIYKYKIQFKNHVASSNASYDSWLTATSLTGRPVTIS